MIKKGVIKIIEVYQKTLSPDSGWFRGRYSGGYCKFTPNCSEYGRLSIIKHGVIRGGARAFFRILRCNPWSKGGEDAA